MAEAPPQHTYPEGWAPGRHWAMDEAWAILDTLRPGTLDEATRNLLAGMIVGTLIRLAGGRERMLGLPPR